MPYSEVLKRHCLNGHDVLIFGRSHIGNCNECDRIRWKKSHVKRQAIDSTINKRRKHLSRYNITVDQYNELFNAQDGKCLICGIHQSKLKRSLAVDHSHVTNKVRGLLCTRCNLLLGHALDNPVILIKASEYLSH